MSGPLAGIRVVEMATTISGPYAAMLLGDLGAEVVKVEEPRAGEAGRTMGCLIRGESTIFLGLNRNKKSLTLNLRDERGRGILYRLVAKSDVFLHNFVPGTAERLRVDYESLQRVNPGVICCAISAFGECGPLREKPAIDLIVQGMTGVMAITGDEEGPPTKVGYAVPDVTAALLATVGILIGLLHRRETGRGRKITISMYDAQVWSLAARLGEALLTGVPLRRTGNEHPQIAPYDVYQSSDQRQVSVAAFNEKLWRRLCQALGREDLLADPRFGTNRDRVVNRTALRTELEAVFRQRTAAEILQLLEHADVPCGPVLEFSEVVAGLPTVSPTMLLEVEHPTVGRVPMVGLPIKLEGVPERPATAAPRLGAHTSEILRDLGMAAEEIDALRRDAVV